MAEETPAAKDSSRKSKKRGKDRSEDELTRLFSGEGVSYRAKIIGSEPVTAPSGHKICEDAMMKLKAVASASRARGQHKQRVALSISFKGIRVSDEKSGVTEYEHPIGFISYVARDTSDPRAFGYVCGATGAHCFYAVKTVQQAEPLVMDIHDVFQLLRSNRGQQPQSAGGGAIVEQKNFQHQALFGEISTSIEPPSPMSPAEGWPNPTWGSPCDLSELIRGPSSGLENAVAPLGPASVAHVASGAAKSVVVLLDGACGGETDTDDVDHVSAQAPLGAALDDSPLYASVSKRSQPEAQQADPFALPPLSFDDDFTASLVGPPVTSEANRVPTSITIPSPLGDGLPVPAVASGSVALAGPPQAVPPLGFQQQQQQGQQRQQQQTGRLMPQMTQAAAILASMANQASVQQNSGSSQPTGSNVYREAFAGLEQPTAVSQQAWLPQGQALQPAWPAPGQIAQQAWPLSGQVTQQAWPSPGQVTQQAWPSPGQVTQQAWPAPHQAFQPVWPQNQGFQPAWPSQNEAFQSSWPSPNLGPGSGGQASGVKVAPDVELDLALGGDPAVSVFPETAPEPPTAQRPGPALPPTYAGPDPFGGLMGGVKATTK